MAQFLCDVIEQSFLSAKVPSSRRHAAVVSLELENCYEVIHTSKRHKSVESTTVQGFMTPNKRGMHVFMGVRTQTLSKNEPQTMETVTTDA